MKKMGSYTKLFLLAGIISLGVIIIDHEIQDENKKLTGYITPEAERTFMWTEDDSFKHVPYRTVEVVLSNTGQRVEAVISNARNTPYYIQYGDCPEARNKRVIVKIKEHDGEYTIVSGEIEE